MDDNTMDRSGIRGKTDDMGTGLHPCVMDTVNCERNQVNTARFAQAVSCLSLICQ